MINLKIANAMIRIISGSLGKLIPMPNPTSLTFTDKGIKNTRTNTNISSLKTIRNENKRSIGMRFIQGKSKGIASVLIAINAIQMI
jgi:hypothetical protein